jgi:hypothetical protein
MTVLPLVVRYLIKQNAFYCCNAKLFTDEEAAKATIARWPLRRTA